MSPKGVELMIGAKRDQAWGTVLLVGLGGIWVEALGDVELLPVDAEKEQIMEALNKLRASKLLTGFRGAPPADVEAVAQAVLAQHSKKHGENIAEVAKRVGHVYPPAF